MAAVCNRPTLLIIVGGSMLMKRSAGLPGADPEGRGRRQTSAAKEIENKARRLLLVVMNSAVHQSDAQDRAGADSADLPRFTPPRVSKFTKWQRSDHEQGATSSDKAPQNGARELPAEE